MIRVQVVDDHPMVRRCVRAMLDHAEGGVPPLQALVAAAARLGALAAVLLDWAADDAGQSCANGPPPRWTGYARTAEHDAHVTDHRPA